MFKHILVSSDGSELSRKAMEHAVALAKTVGAKVTGIHVAAGQSYFENAPPPHPDDDPQYADARRVRLEQIFGPLQRAAEEAGVPCDVVEVPGDAPYSTIIETAERQGCDLVVMASHGRRGMAGLLLGSETVKVLTHSKIPVLVLR